MWLSLRARSFFFFNAANPSISNGGFLMESKKEIYNLMPRHMYPATIRCLPGISVECMLKETNEQGISFPMIAKPDIGMQGKGVALLHNENEMKDYAAQSRVPFLLQTRITFPNEVGIFYYRLPQESSGHISGIVSKTFVTLRGDGVSTVEQLLSRNYRHLLQLPALRKSQGSLLATVLQADQVFTLVPFGNHARGALFTSQLQWISDELTATIDDICKQVPDFYYGRLDIRYETWDDLCAGKNFSVIELNGAGSEPTHMYDPKNSLLDAWREIMWHWKMLHQIAMQNKQSGAGRYLTIKQGIAMLRQNSRHQKLLS